MQVSALACKRRRDEVDIYSPADEYSHETWQAARECPSAPPFEKEHRVLLEDLGVASSTVLVGVGRSSSSPSLEAEVLRLAAGERSLAAWRRVLEVEWQRTGQNGAGRGHSEPEAATPVRRPWFRGAPTLWSVGERGI